MAVNTIDKLLFLSFIFDLLLLITVYAIMHQLTKILLKQVLMILEISCFYISQMAIGHHVELLKA